MTDAAGIGVVAGDGIVAAAPPAAPGRPPGLDRRRVLTLALLAPVAAVGLGACSTNPVRGAKGPDPLVALADAARVDAALAAAAIAGNPDLTGRVDPLRAARTEHAAALDAEVVRAGGTPSSATSTAAAVAPPSGSPAADPTVPPTGLTQTVTLARVREAVAASQRGAAQLVPDLPAERVGLVASVAACCATYAAVLV